MVVSWKASATNHGQILLLFREILNEHNRKIGDGWSFSCLLFRDLCDMILIRIQKIDARGGIKYAEAKNLR